MTGHAEMIDEIRRRLYCHFSEKYVNRQQIVAGTPRTDAKGFHFSGVLIAFWHTVLRCAAKCEQFVIDEAARYEKLHSLRTSAWLERESFSRRLRELYVRRFSEPQALAVATAAQLQSGAEYLFPFLMTMRFDDWFDGLPYETNYALQILLRFERALMPSELRCGDTERLDQTLDNADDVFRRVWHKIVFSHTVMLNNSFAFFLESLLTAGSQRPATCDATNAVYWGADWRVVEVFTLAGSFFNARVARNLLAHERVTLPPDGGENPPQEATWIALLLQQSSAGADGGTQQRFVHCSLSSCDLQQDIFVQPWVPFFCLVPTLSPSVVQVLHTADLMASEMQQYFVSDSAVTIIRLCEQNRPPVDGESSCYQIDAVREVQPIGHRMVELFGCMVRASDCMIGLRRDLAKKLDDATRRLKKTTQNRRKANSAAYAAALALQAETEKNCAILQHLRDNSVATFVILNFLQH